MSTARFCDRPASSRPRFLYLILFVGVLGVSISAVIIRLSNAPALIVAAHRMLFTVLFLIPLAIVNRNQMRDFNLRLLLLSILSGLLLALHFAFWITSLDYTSVASSTVIVTTQPIFVVIGSYLIFKEKTSTRAFIFIFTALIGSSLIGLGDFSLGPEAIKGDLLALAGAIFIAGYMLIGRTVRQHIEVIPYTLVVYSAAGLFLVLASHFFNLSLYPYPVREYVLFLLLALFSTVFGHTIFNWAMRYVSAITVSTSILGEPIGATLLAVLILRELPTFWQISGGIVVIVSLFFFMKEQYRISHFKS